MITVKPVRKIYAAVNGEEWLIRHALYRVIEQVPKRLHRNRMYGKALRQLLGRLPKPLLEKILEDI